MTVETSVARQARADTVQGIVDCDVHPSPRSLADFARYLPERWRAHIAEYGLRIRQPFIGAPTYPKSQPALARRDAWPDSGGPPGSDLDFMRAQHLDPNGITHGLLHPLSPRGMDERNQDFGRALCRAINEWQIAEWTSRDPRLKATISVPGEDAESAVAEIEHWAGYRDFVQVSPVTRAFEPLGRRRYWPIYAEAEAHGLPLGLHSVGTNGTGTGGGWPSYYFEEHQATAFSIAGMLTSLLIEGVFERFPRLRVVAIEGGFGWAPSLAWRLDCHWERFRSEVPHLKRPPSEYLRTNVWFTTQPVEEPEKLEDLRRIVDWIGWDRLLFSTDYPHWDSDDPRHAFKFPMTQAERRALFFGNAHAVYQLD